MKILYLLCLWLLLSIYCATSFATQVMSPLTAGVARAVKSNEGGWSYTPGVCTCGRITAGELQHNVATWERTANRRRGEIIRVDIYDIASAEEAARWMNQWNREVAIGWPQVKRYDLADEAYLLNHRGGNNSANPFTIFFRRKNIIVEVSGESLSTVERFARYAVKGLPAS